MKLTAIIIDDNKASIKLLVKLLEDFFTSIKVIGTFVAVNPAVEAVKKEKPDIVFLDVEMPLENGFKLFEHIPQPDFETIFITAYAQYAAEAFRVGSIDYLIKPIDPQELKEAIHRVEQKRISAMVGQRDRKIKLAIPTKSGIEFIVISNILYCQAHDNYSFIHFERTKLLVSKTLKTLQSLLESSGFFRTSRSYLVNVKHIKSISSGRKGTVILEDESVIPISQDRRKILLDLLSNQEIINL